MKDKFQSFITTVFKPWEDGSSGIPGSISTMHLVAFGNSSLQPDIAIDSEGQPYNVYLTSLDVEEVMKEPGFALEHVHDPFDGFISTWKTEEL